MKFLANENWPGGAVTAMRALGHDVAWASEDSPGSSDDIVLARAAAERLILLTFDKDFGELAWRTPRPAACGVILFRIPMPSASAAGAALAAIVCSRSDWAGHFSVVELGRIRMRALPRLG